MIMMRAVVPHFLKLFYFNQNYRAKIFQIANLIIHENFNLFVVYFQYNSLEHLPPFSAGNSHQSLLIICLSYNLAYNFLNYS